MENLSYSPIQVPSTTGVSFSSDDLIGLSEPPASWGIIPPDQTISRHVEVLLSADATIISVDNLECIDQRLSRGPFTHLSPSPNGKMLALLTFSGVLWVVSTDFHHSRLEFDIASQSADGKVKQVEWCGNDAILVSWDGLALMVGPLGDSLKYANLPLIDVLLICLIDITTPDQFILYLK